MTEQERIERNQNIIKDIKAKMTNAQLKEKYGLDKTAIKKIAKKAGITRKANAEVQVELAEEEKVTGGDTFSNDEQTIEDLQDQNDNLKDELAECQKHIAALEATVKELKAESAHIGHASIDVLDEKQSKDYIIHIMKCGDDPERDEVCDYDEALNILMKYNPKIDEDYIRKTLSTYDQKTERKLGGRTTIVPNHGTKFKALDNDIKDWKDAYQKLNERINDLEDRL